MPFTVNEPGHVAEHNRLAQALPPGFVPASTDSPALTGTPTAPTPPVGDSSGNIATTEFVGSAASYAALNAGTAAVVTQRLYARTIPTPTFSGTGQIRPLTTDPNVAGRVWFSETAHDYIGFTDDHGATATTKVLNPSHSSGFGVVQMTFAGSTVWLVTTGTTGAKGQVWSSPAPDASGNGLSWTLKFDLAAPPAGITVGNMSAFRNSCVAISGSNVYLVEYSVATITGGPSLYYSSNSGSTWTKTYTWANGKHCHSVKVLGGVPWVMIGDGGFTDIGLWVASSASAASWVRRSLYGEANGGNTNYGINMLPASIEGQAMVLSEYDGNRSYGPLVFPSQTPTVTGALLPQCTLPGAYVGTMRQMTMTSEGNLMWVTTGEGGAVGPLDSVWIARPPFTTPVLLEALPSSANTFTTMGDPVEDGDYVWFGTNRCRKELYVGQ